MARFQIFDSPEGDGYLLDVESDLIDMVRTRIVVPLLPARQTPPDVARLHPVFAVGGQDHVMATHLIATVPVEILAAPRGDLSEHRDRITAALDMLFHGF